MDICRQKVGERELSAVKILGELITDAPQWNVFQDCDSIDLLG